MIVEGMVEVVFVIIRGGFLGGFGSLLDWN